MKNLKYSLLFLSLAQGCGTPDQSSSTHTITPGRVSGNYSSWITTNTTTKFEDAKIWAQDSGMTYFPEASWVPSDDILWTYDSTRSNTIRSEIKTDDLRNDKSTTAILLADWFRYLPVNSFPSPMWNNSSTDTVSSGFFLINSFNNLDSANDLVDEIYFKTFVRMKGTNSTGKLKTKLIVVCSGQETVVHANENILMPKPLFTEIVSESNLTPETLSKSDWKYFKADVMVKENTYQPMADRCKNLQGELVAYLDIDISKAGSGDITAQFIASEMIAVGGDN